MLASVLSESTCPPGWPATPHRGQLDESGELTCSDCAVTGKAIFKQPTMTWVRLLGFILLIFATHICEVPLSDASSLELSGRAWIACPSWRVDPLSLARVLTAMPTEPGTISANLLSVVKVCGAPLTSILLQPFQAWSS